MKKLFIAAFLIFGFLSANVSAQKDEKSGKISEMISAANKTGSFVSGLLGGGFPDSENAEITGLSAITFPNSVKVKYLGETEKINKPRKKAIDKWLKEYAEKPAGKKFYVNQIAVEEDGREYWVMAHENSVIGKLKTAEKADEIILNLRIIGYYKKGKTIDYFLVAEGVK